mgnify:FL=1|tara:strand:- start:10135 stop:10329 length:195 start_codon:yes stop_codon:yes gene_type:complete
MFFLKGTLVKWSWGNGIAEGKVEETYASKITKTIKGNEVTRNGEKDNKALYKNMAIMFLKMKMK